MASLKSIGFICIIKSSQKNADKIMNHRRFSLILMVNHIKDFYSTKFQTNCIERPDDQLPSTKCPTDPQYV